ncbi:MAG TPA: EpsI family protein [Terriglobales bacterium]|nr:EpsI family protein [Terriglobales bacterium]
MRGLWRFLVAASLLVVTALLLQARSSNEVIPPREQLSALPHQLGDWSGIDVTIPPDQLEILGAGDFLLRVYHTPDLTRPYVDLFVAYFPSQRSGESIHSPKNCLPGAGWSPVESDRVLLSLPDHKPFLANRYVIAKGEDRMLVLYWYLSHNRAVASEYWAKFFLVTDSMRLNRSDGSLIRVTTPLQPGETRDAAQQRLVSLAGNVTPLIDRYVPR